MVFNDAGTAAGSWMRFNHGVFVDGLEYNGLQMDAEKVGRLLQDGLLLPLVDPSDPLAWAGCLADLAEIEGPLAIASNDGVVGRGWTQVDSGDPGVAAWSLRTFTASGARYSQRSYLIDTDDPAEALVLAMISLREELDK